MRDIRDALVALTQSAGEVGDSLTFGCDCEGCTKTATGLADAILAEFDVTPRGEGMTIQIGGRRAGKTQDLAERVADEVMKRGGSATVISLPSVEDVARALNAPVGFRWSDNPEGYRAHQARAVLALFEEGEGRG